MLIPGEGRFGRLRERLYLKEGRFRGRKGGESLAGWAEGGSQRASSLSSAFGAKMFSILEGGAVHKMGQIAPREGGCCMVFCLIL